MERYIRKTRTVLKSYAKSAFDKAGIDIKKKPNFDDRHVYRELFPSESLEKRRFYTVSAGGHLGFGTDFEHPYWTNIDLYRPIADQLRPFNSENDLCHDLMDAKPLPIDSDSAEIILSQYAIEHIPESAVTFFFKDALRALKPGGILKIVTPNTELDVLAYQNRDLSYFHWNDWKSVDGIYQNLGYKTPLNQASLEQVFVAHFAANASELHAGKNPNQISDEEIIEVMSSMSTEDALDHITARCCPIIQREFRENHMSWWSPTKLVRELEKAGFRKTTILAPCQSGSRVLRNNAHFDKLWNDVATFVEAVK